MATYNNKHWLLSHIRNSYIATDDTGMCEAVMMSDDLPNRFMDMCRTRRTTQPTATSKSSTANIGSTPIASTSTAATTAAAGVFTPTTSKSQPNHHQHTHLPHHNSSLQSHRGYHHNRDDNFEWYPGLDQSDDEDLDPMSQSYDILMDHDHGIGGRKHNNIAAPKYDKKDARRRASKVRSIKLDDNVVELNDDEIDEFFPRRDDYNTVAATNTNSTTSTSESHEAADECEKAVSLLAKRLEEVRQQPVNEFQQFAQFDGNQMSVATKTFKIFLTMLPKEQQNYPMDVCVIATAKIQEFIGLICYRCSLTYDVPLLSLQNYALYITEGDGEIDDFPPLDLREPCGKFRFSHLALVQRKEGDIFKLDSRPTSETESTLDSPLLSHDLMMDRSINDPKDMERMNDHTVQMEAPLYRSYHVKMVTSGPFKAHVQLGISGEKMEIDPIHTQNSKLAKQFSRLKPVSHSMETVVYCDIIDQNRSRSVIRFVYSIISDYQPQQSHSTTYYAHSLNDPNVVFRHYDFVTKPAQAAEIVEKVNNIIEVRSSSNRREYLSRNPSAIKKKRHTFSFRKT